MNRSKRTAVEAAMLVAAAALGPGLASAAATNRAAGEQRRWALEFRTRLDQPAGPPIEVALTGEWTSTIVAARSAEYDAALEIAGVHLTGNAGGNVAPEALEQTERRLSRRFWATYRSDGTLLRIYFFKDVSPSDRNLLQMVATEAQFVRPEASKMVWNTLERDGAGNYLAIYNVVKSNAVLKRKLKYVHTDAEPGTPADGLHLDVEQSEIRAAFDPDGEINSLDGSERIRVGGSRREKGRLVVLTEIRLSNLRKANEPQLIGSLARAGSEVVSSPILTHRADPEKLQAERDAQLLEGHSTESLLEAATKKESDDNKLSARLAAMFRRRPNAIPAALVLLRRDGANKQVTYALGTAHTAAAIEALAALARDQATPAFVRIDALAALVSVQHPSVEAMRIPIALLDDNHAQVASAARMMGGTVAHNGRKEHPAEADVLDGMLISRYRKAQDVADVCNLLAALGNSAGPSLVPVLVEALSDPRVPVRAAAARGLRLAESPEIDNLLAAAITGDLDPQVRSAAIFSTRFRRPTLPLIQALTEAAKTDSVEYVRSEAVAQLRAHSRAFPEIPETLAWIAAHDEKPGIRRLAGDGLPTAISGNN